MGSKIAKIEVYPDYADDGSMDLDLSFSYGCDDLSLYGYRDIETLIMDIRNKLKEEISA